MGDSSKNGITNPNSTISCEFHGLKNTSSRTYPVGGVKSAANLDEGRKCGLWQKLPPAARVPTASNSCLLLQSVSACAQEVAEWWPRQLVAGGRTGLTTTVCLRRQAIKTRWVPRGVGPLIGAFMLIVTTIIAHYTLVYIRKSLVPLTSSNFKYFFLGKKLQNINHPAFCRNEQQICGAIWSGRAGGGKKPQ